MILRGLVLALAGASPARADDSPWCQNLWLSINTVYDRAGYCFETPLGRAVFDNAGCTPGEPRLSPLDAEIVRRLSEMTGSCDMDTDMTELHPRAARFAERLAELWTIPIRDETEHACRGYLGPARDLHAGISTETTIIGRLEPGQGFYFAYEPMPPDWEYISVSDAEGNPVGHGWVRGITMSDETCTDIIG